MLTFKSIKMKKIFLYSSIALTAFLSSCSDLDDNISPNNVDPSLISPRQTLSASENLVLVAQAGTMTSLSNLWTNTWAGNNFYFGNPSTREYSLDISNTFGTGIWSSSYNAANNLQQIINNGDKLPLHSAIAKILKAYTLQYVVDFYGDAPYSEAFQGQNNLTPKYDDDAAIYRNLVTGINEAIAAIPDASTPIPGDIAVNANEDNIFGGDMQKWKKFAKNIKLKILLRQSKVTDPTVRSFVDAQLQTLAGADPTNFWLEDVAVNPGFSVKNGSTPNPFYNNYGAFLYDGSATNTNGWRLYKAAQYYANAVNGISYGLASRDLRGSRMFRRMTTGDGLQSAANVAGIQQGAAKTSASEWSVSYLGGVFIGSEDYVPYTSDVSTSNVYYGYYYADSASKNDVAAKGGSANGYLALASENQLLLSEAAVLYPTIFTFDAQTRYNAAVNNSFSFYGLTSAQATAYLSGINTTSVGWTLSTNKIAAIQFQRLASLANLRAVETYINFLKTGYPAIPLALNAIYPNKPYRLIYPSSEYVGNSSNVPNVSQAQVFAKNQYTPFWNQN